MDRSSAAMQSENRIWSFHWKRMSFNLPKTLNKACDFSFTFCIIMQMVRLLTMKFKPVSIPRHTIHVWRAKSSGLYVLATTQDGNSANYFSFSFMRKETDLGTHHPPSGISARQNHKGKNHFCAPDYWFNCAHCIRAV